MKENKVISPGFTILFYLMVQERMQKTRFLNLGITRKWQIDVIMQVSWHNSVSTFKI